MTNRETWRHLETRPGTGWHDPTVYVLECPRGHRVEVPSRETGKDYFTAMVARRKDPDPRAMYRDFEDWIACPPCGRSFPWVQRIFPPVT